MAEEKTETKKKNKRKDNALRRFILRRTGADNVVAGLEEGMTPEQAAAEREKQRKNRKK